MYINTWDSNNEIQIMKLKYIFNNYKFYEKHLDKFIGYFNYWNIVNNGLKCANLKYMHKFYKLANHICNTIVNYKINSAKSKTLIQNSTNYLNQYISLYGKISECTNQGNSDGGSNVGSEGSNGEVGYADKGSFLNNIINNVSIGSKKIEISSNLDDKKPESKDTRDGLPTPDDSLPLQEDSPQTSL
ncbi:fam-a protein [Plasmodium yoelii]|uniref:Fam-a protein n=1 Tax=Plasmodium yoelii TaxID=5861 RepID=A0A078K796_PLAYE|nr:fam-a protein [Plasmodium yoelii]CDU16590.1 fam-a protein [Plasmodium yoelii]VTZ73522.1 fam-a protein [Plasmodium yoelii]|eukprot:XP_022811602.1 fam-a protein [Plasmodium yoelii]